VPAGEAGWAARGGADQVDFVDELLGVFFDEDSEDEDDESEEESEDEESDDDDDDDVSEGEEDEDSEGVVVEALFEPFAEDELLEPERLSFL
jgi:hypothetical protein